MNNDLNGYKWQEKCCDEKINEDIDHNNVLIIWFS